MPWLIEKDGSKFCVKKKGPDGNAIGESLGCHDTENDASEQLRALYAQEPDMKSNLMLGSVRFIAEDNSDPRFLVFKRAVLARAEVNGNRDSVTEKELQEVAASIAGTAIDLEHDENRNYGVYTVGVVEPDPEHDNIPTLFTDGYFWSHRLAAANIHPEDIEGEKPKYRLSIEADADEAECSVCHGVFKEAKMYCAHLKERIRYKAVRIMRGLRAFGGALVRRPAGTDTGFARSTLRMVASHAEEMETPHMESSEELYARIATLESRLSDMEAKYTTPAGPPGENSEEANMADRVDEVVAPQDVIAGQGTPGEAEQESTEMKATVAQLQAKLDVATKRVDDVTKVNDELRAELKASKTRYVRQKLVGGAVVTVEQFDKNPDEFVNLSDTILELMLKSAAQAHKPNGRMTVMASEDVAQDELSV